MRRSSRIRGRVKTLHQPKTAATQILVQEFCNSPANRPAELHLRFSKFLRTMWKMSSPEDLSQIGKCSILKEFLKEELLLFRDTERYRSIMASRLIALVVSSTLAIAVWQISEGKVEFDVGFVLSVFSIFISWLFFWAADRSAERQKQEVKILIESFEKATHRRFDSIEKAQSNTLTTPYKPGVDVSSLPSISDNGEFAKIIAEALNETTRQLLIALEQFGVPVSENFRVEFGYETERNTSLGFATIGSVRSELAKLHLIEFDPKNNTVSLSPSGIKVVRWMEKNGFKAPYFESPSLGTWGAPSERFIRHKERYIRRRAQQEDPAETFDDFGLSGD